MDHRRSGGDRGLDRREEDGHQAFSFRPVTVIRKKRFTGYFIKQNPLPVG